MQWVVSDCGKFLESTSSRNYPCLHGRCISWNIHWRIEWTLLQWWEQCQNIRWKNNNAIVLFVSYMCCHCGKNNKRIMSSSEVDIQICQPMTGCAYHHWCCEFKSRSGQSVQHYLIKFVGDLRQVSGFLRVLRFPPSIKQTATIY